MARLLIAVQSKLLASYLVEALIQYEIHICHTGTDALELLDSLRPDILIMEFSLPIISGLSILDKTDYKPAVVLGLTNFVTESLLQAAYKHNVQDILLLPCTVQCIVGHLEVLVQKHPALEA